MISNYLRIALRNIGQNPVYAGINIFSLAIGLAACVVIYLFIADESSFDSFHSQKDRIFRMNETQNFSGTNFQKVALTGSPMGPATMKEFPEIANYTRFWGGARRVLRLGEKNFMVDKVATVDSSFLTIFNFKMLHGDPKTALDEPNSMVLTRKTALKFFDDPADAIGSLISKRGREYKVTGIVEDVPENSHLQFDAVESFETFLAEDPSFNTDWNGNFLVTYVLLKPNTTASSLESKFAEWLVRWTGEEDVGKAYTLYLQPLNEVHLNSSDIEHDYQNYRKFNGEYLQVFMIVGVLILVIASVNFMNLTTARAAYRWKEVGVRTSVGARKKQLFTQFLSESMLATFVALAVALLLDFLFVPVLNELIGRQLHLGILLTNPINMLWLLGLTLALGLLSGIYPSLFLTSVNPALVLKGAVRQGGRSVFRSSLVVLQFGLAIAMIASTWIVLSQLNFMKNTDAGFDKDQILLVELEDRNIKMQHLPPNGPYKEMKKELQNLSFVSGVTASGQRLGNNFHQGGFKVRTDTGVVNFAPSNVNVDPDYLSVYGIELLEGRTFSEDIPTDNGMAFIINESLAKYLNIKDPVGRPGGRGWLHNDSLGTIIGVVRNFHFNSLHHKINTLAISSNTNWDFTEMSIKIKGSHVSEAVDQVKKIYEKHVHNLPFSYTFLDQHFETLYRSDQQMSSVVTIMAGLAILISCMGLFGLVVITTERMIKEIGIRKALGATEMQITTLLLSNFSKLVMVAFILASPVTYYFLDRWLLGFAYRINLSPVYLVLSGLAALLIAVLTVSYHAIRYARANPVKALRYE